MRSKSDETVVCTMDKYGYADHCGRTEGLISSLMWWYDPRSDINEISRLLDNNLDPTNRLLLKRLLSDSAERICVMKSSLPNTMPPVASVNTRLR